MQKFLNELLRKGDLLCFYFFNLNIVEYSTVDCLYGGGIGATKT